MYEGQRVTSWWLFPVSTISAMIMIMSCSKLRKEEIIMYVCMVITYSRVWINRVRLPILLVVSWTGKIIFPCLRACLRIWSRETGSAVPSRVSLLISILRLNLVLTYGIPPEFRGGVHMKPPYAIGSVPSLSGHAVAYRWRSLPRVRRHRASTPQGSSERVLPWQITMDQLIFASLSHTHYWYKVGMLKVHCTGRPGSSEVHRHPLTRWDVSSIPANGIFLTKKNKKKWK